MVTYSINLVNARANVPGAEHLSDVAERHLASLVELLQNIADDVRVTADDLIRLLTIHVQCCNTVAEQAFGYAREDGDLPTLGD